MKLPQVISDLKEWCRKYVSIAGLAVVAAIIYMIFFQENSMTRIYNYNRTIDSLRAEIAVHQDSMRLYRELNTRLDNRDPEIIERVVRENHNMNRPDEDVYVFK